MHQREREHGANTAPNEASRIYWNTGWHLKCNMELHFNSDSYTNSCNQFGEFELYRVNQSEKNYRDRAVCIAHMLGGPPPIRI